MLGARVVALTNVSLDHTDVLGETREAIAAEKLAVVGAGATVVLGEPQWEAAARAQGAAEIVHADDVGRAAAAALLGRELEGEVEISLPGRFDVVGEDVFAGAHNPSGVEWLLERLPRSGYTIVASILAGKDVEPMLRTLARAGRTLVATESHNTRSLSAADLAARRHAVLLGGRNRPRPGGCPRARARAGGGCRRSPRHRLALSARGGLRPARANTMGKLGERLSVFAVAAIVVLAIIGLAFAAGYLVGRILL